MRKHRGLCLWDVSLTESKTTPPVASVSRFHLPQNARGNAEGALLALQDTLSISVQTKKLLDDTFTTAWNAFEKGDGAEKSRYL